MLAGSQVFEKLVDYQQDAVVGMDLSERRHHLLEGGLVVDDLVGWREGIADAVLVKEYLKLLRDDVPQGHLARNLDPVNLEFSGNGTCGLGYLGMADHRDICGVF